MKTTDQLLIAHIKYKIMHWIPISPKEVKLFNLLKSPTDDEEISNFQKKTRA